MKLAVDCVVFGYALGGAGDRLEVLLVRRGLPPFLGEWALPGGFVHEDEDLPDAARRELREEAGVDGVALDQLGAFGAPGRDPRERVVSVAFTALLPASRHRPVGGTDASSAAWLPVDAVPALAFDHAEILAAARDRLRREARYTPLGFELLPDTFTLPQLQRLYEQLLGEALDPRNFRKKLASMGLVIPTGELDRAGVGRPARTWRFNRPVYEALTRTGFELRL